MIIQEYVEENKERFYGKFDVKSNNECWVWKGGLDKDGYGKFNVKLKNRFITKSAHRISFELTNGEILDEVKILHSCDNPSCVNPFHLLSGTHKQNMQDMKEKGRAAKGNNNGKRLYPEKNKKGEENKASKLTEKDVKEICDLLKNKVFNNVEISKLYCVHVDTIWRIKSGKIWSHITKGLL